MKYLAAAVLLAILIGLARYALDHPGDSPTVGSGSGWMQR